MPNLSQSPCPNNSDTLFVPRPNHATGEIVWGFWLTIGGRSHYADWAMPTAQIEALARKSWEVDRKTAAYQYYMPYSDTLALRPVEGA